MPTLISHPTRIEASGSKPKVIEEYVGRINSRNSGLSVAQMRSPEGWEEPGQTPEFDEYTLVLRGTLRVQHRPNRDRVRIEPIVRLVLVARFVDDLAEVAVAVQQAHGDQWQTQIACGFEMVAG